MITRTRKERGLGFSSADGEGEEEEGGATYPSSIVLTAALRGSVVGFCSPLFALLLLLVVVVVVVAGLGEAVEG